ncbi:hypothetical protein GCM10022403_009900 [Streptomyces coacervatus]|uniref:Uncharacterized protein n=1 Tax=Streptomyces coacervatus TaxID=647381 RepID=A0ABP7GYC4_9ACTN
MGAWYTAETEPSPCTYTRGFLAGRLRPADAAPLSVELGLVHCVLPHGSAVTPARAHVLTLAEGGQTHTAPTARRPDRRGMTDENRWFTVLAFLARPTAFFRTRLAERQ